MWGLLVCGTVPVRLVLHGTRRIQPLSEVNILRVGGLRPGGNGKRVGVCTTTCCVWMLCAARSGRRLPHSSTIVHGRSGRQPKMGRGPGAFALTLRVFGRMTRTRLGYLSRVLPIPTNELGPTARGAMRTVGNVTTGSSQPNVCLLIVFVVGLALSKIWLGWA